MGLASRLSLRHRLLALFVAPTLIPSLALAWLGWQVVQQDRQLEQQRVRDALEAVISSTAAGIERELSALDRSLASLLKTGLGSEHGDSAVVVRFTQDGVVASAGAALLYRPALRSARRSAAVEPWLKGERLEFEQKDLEGAIRAYRLLARAADSQIRAGALLRQARVLKKAGHYDEALAIYATMATLDSASVGDAPADLVARRARIELLDRIDRDAELSSEATALWRDLSTGRWPLDRISYLTFAQDLERWVDESSRPARHALALSESVSHAWDEWRTRDSLSGATSGRRTNRLGGLALLEVWRDDGGGLLFFAATPEFLAGAWRSVWPDGFSVSLIDNAGNSVLGGTAAGSAITSIRAASETRLPWTLKVSAGSTPDGILAAGRTRRKLLLAGLALVTILVGTTGYVVNRAVRRELAVAKQQADFVSAVSHEFRSPLTSLTHLISLLRGEFQPTDERRRQYYDVLARETDRLRRFVETLLEFGRMQAGATRFRLTTLSLTPVVQQVVEEFTKDHACGSHPMRFDGGGLAPMVAADVEALKCAMWNLLENAAKYSPDTAPIEVRLERQADAIAIRVIDQGLGIPTHEQPHVFDQFFRGEAASSSAVKGTGVGLAVVSHIVRSHDGKIQLESKPGVGSTFSIVLPAHNASANDSSRLAS